MKFKELIMSPYFSMPEQMVDKILENMGVKSQNADESVRIVYGEFFEQMRKEYNISK